MIFLTPHYIEIIKNSQTDAIIIIIVTITITMLCVLTSVIEIKSYHRTTSIFSIFAKQGDFEMLVRSGVVANSTGGGALGDLALADNMAGVVKGLITARGGLRGARGECEGF